MIIALLISLFLLLGMPMMGQNPTIALPADGDWPTIVGDSIMLIGPRQNELTEEQRYFNPPYLLIYPGKEHLTAQMIRAGLCDCDPTKPNRRIGVFSVAPDKQVSFSQGNLQYLPAANIWKFADTQYEYLGNANKYLKPTFRNWVDLFGWSANNTTAPFGVSTSTNAADYAGDFVDWGENEICGDAPGTWRTLSADEWEYLLKKRKNASDLYGVAQVAGVNGMIILPDDWEEANGIVFKSGLHSSQVNDYSVYQSFTNVQWLAMENAGAVFLPALGYRDGTNVEKCDTSGYYWSNTTSDENSAYRLYFYSYFLAPNDVHGKYRGRSVRLVHDTIVPKLEPEYVDLGLSVKWATFNVGATKPEDYGDYFAWGETEPKEEYTWENYKWCDGTDANITKYNTTDGKTILEPADDAAQVHWGGKWRMPTKEEQQELIDRCRWERTNLNGVIGYKVTGPNGNSIFIPIAGAYNSFDNQLNSVGSIGWIYSSTIATEIRAYEIHIEEGGIQQKDCSRCVGLTIRPVYDDIPDPCIVVKVNDTLSINMMCVEGGTFTMGDGENAHPVSLSSYSIGQTEVTQALWEAVMGTNPSANTTNKQLPVIKISWYDCQEFIKKLNQQTGMRFRLPTEAEWEYAARGGQKSKGYTYAGSNDLKEVAWYNGNSGNRLHAVAQKKPNELGIYDMSGNAWEWCEDYYDTDETMHVVKSGSFYDSESACRIDSRTGRAADYKSYIGLRLVLDERSTPPEPEYVDLGLSVKWATFNVGATSPEDYGDYFAWGETEPKDEYSGATYKWCDGTANTFTKYCSNSQYGNADYKTTLDPEDDAAIVHLGGNWRMPTIEEWMELKQNCTWKKITINGMTGYQVTAKNGNSIFLPRAGLRRSDILYANDSVGYYASSSHLPEFSHEDYASYMLMYDNSISKSSARRYYGLPIRPVYDDIPDPCLVVKVNDTLSINMMCVEGGTFTMGAMEGDEIAKDDEKPAHKVILTYDYHIMQTEVTQGLWEAVMGEDIYVAQTNMENAPKPAYVGADYPMYYVRMNDALEFIDKLNAMTGMHFRLPTEAEWEYAARGGNKSKGYLYAGSNNADDVGWYIGRGGLHRVAQLKPNELGIYDMSGNVSEMCLDYGTYGETYKAGDAVNPRGNIRSNGNRFWRGGCYTHSKDSMRVSQRSSYTPSWGGTWMGLRLVLAEDNDFRTIRVGNSYFDMSFVKGGTFMMGSDASDAEADEQPVHEVTLSDYYIGQTEVTQHLWKKVMGDDNNPSAVEGNNLPVTNITWDEAQTFVERLSELTGMRFRLPTEAEWEYAARGGQKSKGYTYAGSDDIDEVGWYNGNSGNTPHAVGQKQPNELGIYDMTGNVYEFCYDWYGPYSADPQTNPTGAATGEKHVLRGGCYHYDSKNDTNTNRHSYYTPDKGGASTGLRIVLEVDK